MRSIILAMIVLFSAAGTAEAYCADTPDLTTGSLASQTNSMLCSYNQSSALANRKTQQLDLQSQLQALQLNIQQQQRQQQMIYAAPAPVVPYYYRAPGF